MNEVAYVHKMEELLENTNTYIIHTNEKENLLINNPIWTRWKSLNCISIAF